MSDASDPSLTELDELRHRLAAQESRLEELQTTNRRRRRGSVAHIAGYVGVLVIGMAASAGALAGANTVFSDDIVNGNVKTADLANNAVTSAKVADNKLTGADIAEAGLNLSSFFAAAEGYNEGGCFADAEPQVCATANLSLARASQVLVTASGTYDVDSVAGDAADRATGEVRLLVDGVPVADAFTVLSERLSAEGELPTTLHDAWAFNDLVNLTAGNHTLALQFTDSDGDVDIKKVRVVAVQVNS